MPRTSADHRLHRAPHRVAKPHSGFFDGLQRAGENLIGVHQLQAQPIDGLAHHAIHALHLGARHMRDLRGVGDHAGDVRLHFFHDRLQAAR